jgi:hypothetical protein
VKTAHLVAHVDQADTFSEHEYEFAVWRHMRKRAHQLEKVDLLFKLGSQWGCS